MKKGIKSLFSWTRVICLTVALIAVMAYAMTVDTLSQMQPTLIVGGQDVAIQAQPTIADTGQELVAALTPVKSIYLDAQFAPATAEVPEPYNNLTTMD